MNTTQTGQPNPYAPPKAAVHDVVDESQRELAGRGTRLGAAILDTIIIGVAFWLPLWMGGTISFTGTGIGWAIGDVASIGTAVAVLGLALWIYFTVKFVKANGQSIAKKMMGIKVIRTSGEPISLARIFWLRNVVNTIPSMIPLIGTFYGLIDALLIFGQPRQCLHDKIADTIVIKA
jgi:uncharacterized RDD family membrane protein YckC